MVLEHRRSSGAGMLIAAVSGSTTPVEMEDRATRLDLPNGSEHRRSSANVAMETILATYWKSSFCCDN